MASALVWGKRSACGAALAPASRLRRSLFRYSARIGGFAALLFRPHRRLRRLALPLSAIRHPLPATCYLLPATCYLL
ncbi:MAG: hypothetical protein ABJE10_02855, partial [bacterium]